MTDPTEERLDHLQKQSRRLSTTIAALLMGCEGGAALGALADVAASVIALHPPGAHEEVLADWIELVRGLLPLKVAKIDALKRHHQ